MAKHRAPRYVRTKHVISRAPVAAGATVVGLGVLSSPAQADTPHDWTGVAECESSGDWSINTGNGYYGGLQFSQATWAGFGGTDFAARADLASPAEQIAIAEKVLDGQGIGAWPTCGKFLTDGTTAVAVETAPAPTEAEPSVAPQVGAGDYTVAAGDTLAKIAAAHGLSWQGLYEDNLRVIGSDPNVIFPGQVLVLTGAGDTAEATDAVASGPEGAPTAAAAPLAASAPTSTAQITNSAGDVQPQAQAAADRVVSDVPGADGLTIGGTRSSATDPNGHPAGLALDYMVGSDAALGDAIVQYHVAHWDELGVEYLIFEQQILLSPTSSWRPMEDRGSVTANHFDHVHVNYEG
jgi:LysM repeat protein